MSSRGRWGVAVLVACAVSGLVTAGEGPAFAAVESGVNSIDEVERPPTGSSSTSPTPARESRGRGTFMRA